MVGYKSGQPMNTAWLIARKWDRIDIGDFSPVAMFRKLEVLFWAHRAVNPTESEQEEIARKTDEGESFRTITELMESVASRLRSLHTPDKKLRMHDDSLSLADTDIEIQLSDIGAELWEITVRCKLIDNVRASEGGEAL